MKCKHCGKYNEPEYHCLRCLTYDTAVAMSGNRPYCSKCGSYNITDNGAYYEGYVDWKKDVCSEPEPIEPDCGDDYECGDNRNKQQAEWITAIANKMDEVLAIKQLQSAVDELRDIVSDLDKHSASIAAVFMLQISCIIDRLAKLEEGAE